MHILLLLLLSYYYFAIVIKGPTRPEPIPTRTRRPDPNQKKAPRVRGLGSYIYGRGLLVLYKTNGGAAVWFGA